MSQRKAFSLVEIVLAIGLMALVLVPIVGLLQNSHRKIADEKAEASVSTFASSIFNKALFQQPYVDVVSESGEEVIDGTTIRWNLEVEQVDLKLTYWRVKYHEPCAGGAASGAIELYPAADNKSPSEIDVKYDDGEGVLKTLKLTLTWRSFYESFDTEDPRKVLVLATRKARLE